MIKNSVAASIVFYLISLLTYNNNVLIVEAYLRVSHPIYDEFTELQLQSFVNRLRGDDNRLMRWDASDYTYEQQSNGGCENLNDVLNMLVNESLSSIVTDKAKVLACEYITLCTTENPYNRYLFSLKNGIHKAMIQLVNNPNSSLSAMASNVVYITSHASKENQHTYYEKGALLALGSIIKNEKAASFTSVQIMWAAAALQNLAASYCMPKIRNNDYVKNMGGEEDVEGVFDFISTDEKIQHLGGERCLWDWTAEETNIVIRKESLPILSDGRLIRQELLNDHDLLDTLKMFACRGPVKGLPSNQNVFVGENAIIGRDENNPSIIPWAAVGVLKNLVLEGTSAKEYVEDIMMCLCHTVHSNDWLEANKGMEIMHHMRRSDPCRFYEEEDYFSALTCISNNFIDIDGHTCESYKLASEVECMAPDLFNANLTADTACCECGGGDDQHYHSGVEDESDLI